VITGDEEDGDDEDFGVEVVKDERTESTLLKVSSTRWQGLKGGRLTTEGRRLSHASLVKEHGLLEQDCSC
jgi:hypothetical protein